MYCCSKNIYMSVKIGIQQIQLPITEYINVNESLYFLTVSWNDWKYCTSSLIYSIYCVLKLLRPILPHSQWWACWLLGGEEHQWFHVWNPPVPVDSWDDHPRPWTTVWSRSGTWSCISPPDLAGKTKFPKSILSLFNTVVEIWALDMLLNHFHAPRRSELLFSLPALGSQHGCCCMIIRFWLPG